MAAPFSRCRCRARAGGVAAPTGAVDDWLRSHPRFGAAWSRGLVALRLGLETAAGCALIAGAALAMLLPVLRVASSRELTAPIFRHASGRAAGLLSRFSSRRCTASRACCGVPPRRARRLWQPFDAAALHRYGCHDGTSCCGCHCRLVPDLQGQRTDRAGSGTGRGQASCPDGVVAIAAQTGPGRTPRSPLICTAFGRYGVPLDVVYGPGAPDGIALSELLTPDARYGCVEPRRGRLRASRGEATNELLPAPRTAVPAAPGDAAGGARAVPATGDRRGRRAGSGDRHRLGTQPAAVWTVRSIGHRAGTVT